MPDGADNICDVAPQHCRNLCLPRQTRSATLRTRSENRVPKLAPHDLRRTCARLCHASGGELEQIQFLLGHVSVQTTERYLGCKQRIRSAVNDRIGVGPNP
jgi:integrase